MTMFLRAAATAALLAAIALPVGAQAASTTSAQPQNYTLRTELTDRYHAGAFEGTLALTIYPSGIVQGTYRSADGEIESVTGGLTGGNIWLDIGMIKSLHLSGTFSNGILHTVAAIPGPDTYTFDSTSVKRRG